MITIVEGGIKCMEESLESDFSWTNYSDQPAEVTTTGGDCKGILRIPLIQV